MSGGLFPDLERHDGGQGPSPVPWVLIGLIVAFFAVVGLVAWRVG